MIYWIIYLVGVLFSIALYIFIQWNSKKPIYLGGLIILTFLSAFSWVTFIAFAAVYGSDIVIFDFGKNSRKTKMRE